MHILGRNFHWLHCAALALLLTSAHAQTSLSGSGNVNARTAKSSRTSVKNARTPETIQNLDLGELASTQLDFVDDFGFVNVGQDGNLYLLFGYEQHGLGIIVPDDLAKSRRIELQPPAAAAFQVGTDFAVSEDGKIHQLTLVQKSIARFIFVYKEDGSFEKKLQLDIGRDWIPAHIALFSDGSYLVYGTTNSSKDPEGAYLTPFLGIFSQDGVLKREIKEDADAKIAESARSGDTHFVVNGTGNKAVLGGTLLAAPNGNIFVVRLTSPIQVVEVSAGGSIVNHFEVLPPVEGLDAGLGAIAGSQGLVFGYKSSDGKNLYVHRVGFDGKNIGTYHIAPEITARIFPGALAQWNPQSQQFAFVDYDLQNKFALRYLVAH